MVPEFVFEMVCRQHDLDYATGGVRDMGEDSRARLLADRAFLRGMIDSAWSASWWKRPLYVMLAWRYYFAVRRFGASAFTFRETQQEIEELTLDKLMEETRG